MYVSIEHDDDDDHDYGDADDNMQSSSQDNLLLLATRHYEDSLLGLFLVIFLSSIFYKYRTIDYLLA